MSKKKLNVILIAMLFSLLVPATWVWAASPPPPPSPTPVGTPAPQRKPNAPMINCPGGGIAQITGTGPGATIEPGGHWAGVIYVTLTDGTVVQSFCIDLYHNTYLGDCYTAGENPKPQVNWLMQNYPPDNNQSNEESAARQAAVWYFSDGYVITGPANIASRTNEITATVPANPTPNPDVPTLRITPSSVNLGSGESYTFTLTALRGGSTPIVGQVVALATDAGTLGANQVTTGANGTATFTISNTPNISTTAHILASFTTNIPAGSVLDDIIPDHQRIMFGASVNAPVTANATAAWWNNPTAVTLSSFSARTDTKTMPFVVVGLILCVSGAASWLVWRRQAR